MPTPCHIHRSTVTFGDTDCSGWLHFPQIFRPVEEAEHTYLKQQGIMVFDRSQGGWPRVHVDCDFKQPLRFGDEIEVHLFIERIGAASVNWAFEVHKAGEIHALGHMTTVRVNQIGKAEEIDATTRARLQP
jgi:acyl-CoA thioester hydrolase